MRFHRSAIVAGRTRYADILCPERQDNNPKTVPEAPGNMGEPSLIGGLHAIGLGALRESSYFYDGEMVLIVRSLPPIEPIDQTTHPFAIMAPSIV